MARHPSRQGSIGRSMFMTAALILSAASAIAFDLAPPNVEYRYATLRSGKPAGASRTLGRTAILYGPTEFLALPRDSEQMTVVELTVLGEVSTAAGPPVLCRSSGSTPNRCTADLGAELITITRAIDRILRARHYWIPNWFLANHRVAHWDVFGWPPTKPDYAFVPERTWWFDEDRAAAIGYEG